MQCPRCSGVAVATLAPGYFECQSQVRVRETRPMQNPANPAEMLPVIEERLVLCGHRFQTGEGASAATCACGVFSIGVCGDCGATVCGLHSGQADGKLRCTKHFNERAEAARRASEESKERTERAAIEQSISDIQAILTSRRGISSFTHTVTWQGRAKPHVGQPCPEGHVECAVIDVSRKYRSATCRAAGWLLIDHLDPDSANWSWQLNLLADGTLVGSKKEALSRYRGLPPLLTLTVEQVRESGRKYQVADLAYRLVTGKTSDTFWPWQYFEYT
jgi:hypothetical protein